MSETKYSIYKIPSTYLIGDLLILRAVSSIHTGVGRRGGIIDLPIQRDEHGFPCIFSSSIKGALKTALLNAFINICGDFETARRAVMALLGPDPEEGESFESSIAILDAYLLAMPVRSLKGVYVYVTSPYLLERFAERLELLENYNTSSSIKQETQEITSKSLKSCIQELLRKVGHGHAICVNDCEKVSITEIGGALLVDEFLLEINSVKNQSCSILKNLVGKLKLEKPLLILDDEDAKMVINRGLLRLTRVRLSRETKTVSTGPWTEEYLPPKTILHTVILYKKPPLTRTFILKILKNQLTGEVTKNLSDAEYLKALKKLRIINTNDIEEIRKTKNLSEKLRKITEKIREGFRNLILSELKGYIIVGGNETIGRGIEKIEFW